MAKYAWLTPDDPPSGLECHKVYIPSGMWYSAAFRGAFILLMESINWEKLGEMEPEACALAFAEAFAETLAHWEETCE